MDVNAIKARLEARQNPVKGSNKSNDERSKHFWKAPVGKHLVRFVPLKSNPENPFIELYVHYQFNKKTMISPINWGEKDPIVEFSKNLSKSKEPEDWKLAKKIKPKMRVFAPVIVRGEEEKGVRFYEFGPQMYDELLAYGADEEVGDFTDTLEGRDFKLDVTQGVTYKESTIRPAMKSSPLSKDPKQVEEWLNNQVDPKDFYTKFSFEDMKSNFEKWLNPEEEAPSVTTTESNQAFPDPKDSPVKREATIAGEFDDLFKD